MSKGSNAEEDTHRLLERHGRYLRRQGMNHLWSVAKTTIVVPHDGKHEGAWLTARRDIRRALRAAGIEPTPIALRAAAGVPLENEETDAMPTSPRLPLDPPAKPLPAAEESRALADAAVSLGERAEALAAEVDRLVADLAAETRRRERAEDELPIVQKKLENAIADLARFNGRDWPRELEQAVAQRKRAEAESIEFKGRVERLEQAIRALSAAGFSVGGGYQVIFDVKSPALLALVEDARRTLGPTATADSALELLIRKGHEPLEAEANWWPSPTEERALVDRAASLGNAETLRATAADHADVLTAELAVERALAKARRDELEETVAKLVAAGALLQTAERRLDACLVEVTNSRRRGDELAASLSSVVVERDRLKAACAQIAAGNETEHLCASCECPLCLAGDASVTRAAILSCECPACLAARALRGPS